MSWVCVSDGCAPRVYSETDGDAEDVAIQYAEHCDRTGDGPSARVVFVRDLNDPDAETIAVSVNVEMEPVYCAAECDDEPSAAMLEALDKEGRPS